MLGGSVTQSLVAAPQAVRGVAPMVAAGVERGASRVASGARNLPSNLKTKTVDAFTKPLEGPEAERIQTLQESFDPESAPTSVFQPSEPFDSDSIRESVGKVGEKVRKVFNRPAMYKEGEGPIAQSIGAARLDDAQRRSEIARGVGVQLTKARASGEPDLIKWENDILNDFEKGQEHRQLAQENNSAIRSKFDEMMEDTGYTLGTDYEKGSAFDKAFWKQFISEKEEVKKAYKEAEEAGHQDDPITLDDFASYINENATLITEGGVLKQALNQANLKGIVDVEMVEARPGLEVVRVTPKPAPIYETERLARFIRNAVKGRYDEQGKIGRTLVDAISNNQEGKGGPLYAAARKRNKKLMDDFVNNRAINDFLVSPKDKRKRAIALENVVVKLIGDTMSFDDTKHIINLLKRSKDGRQVIKEIESATIDKIQQSTYANATWTGLSEEAKASFAKINSQVEKLDRTGKLDLLVGNEKAQRIRDIRDVIKWLNVNPDGTFNNSRSAYMVKGMVTKMMKSKIPFADVIDIVKENIEDKKVRARIIDNLSGFTSQVTSVDRKERRNEPSPEPIRNYVRTDTKNFEETRTPDNQNLLLEGLDIVEVPVISIKQSLDVPQFKSGANNDGVVDPLGGKFDRTGVGPIQIWERLDGTKEVITGRHRLDLARRSGEKTIPAQIHYESQGFDSNKAATLDALLNIREGQGKVKDYVAFIKNAKLTKEEADAQGILARETGKRAYTIATSGSDELIASHGAGEISDLAAVKISESSPNNAAHQSVGIKAIQDGKSISFAENLVKAVGHIAEYKKIENLDLFGFDDSAIREAEKMAKKAAYIQKDIQKKISAVRGASKNPKLAEAQGVKVNDPEGLKKRITELKKKKAEWDKWPTNPELVKILKSKLEDS